MQCFKASSERRNPLNDRIRSHLMDSLRFLLTHLHCIILHFRFTSDLICSKFLPKGDSGLKSKEFKLLLNYKLLLRTTFGVKAITEP